MTKEIWRPDWTEQENQILIDNYGKISPKKIVKLLSNKRTICGLKQHALSLGLKGNSCLSKKKYFHNDNFFDKPNIENSYLAGFIAADGCLFTMPSGKTSLKLNLQKKDEQILYTFKRQMEYTGPISNYILEGREYSLFQIHGANNCAYHLEKYWNITNRKTYTLKKPNVSNYKLSLAYFIGFFDGDGCWCETTYNGEKRYCLSISGTKEMMLWVKNLLNKLVPEIGDTKIYYYPKRSKAYLYKASGKRALQIRSKLNNIIDIPWKFSRKWTN